MNKQLLRIFQAAALLFAVILAGCSPDEEPRAEPGPGAADTTVTLDGISFRPQLPQGHALDTIIRADLDGDGGDELIVASLLRDSTTPASARADYLQFYTLDSAARNYRLLFADSLRWATSIGLADLSITPEPEVVVHTDAGGNDEIATRGMSIYAGGRGKTITRVYQTGRGNPSIEPASGHGLPRIVLHGLYWPPFMTHAQAIRYVDDYLVLRNGAVASVRKEEHDRFMASAEEALGEYGRLRAQYTADTLGASDSLAATAPADSVDEPHPLFVPAALAIIRMGRGGAYPALRSFWGSERDYLERRLPPEQFKELEMLYGGMVDS